MRQAILPKPSEVHFVHALTLILQDLIQRIFLGRVKAEPSTKEHQKKKTNIRYTEIYFFCGGTTFRKIEKCCLHGDRIPFDLFLEVRYLGLELSSIGGLKSSI
jgi:hypothetical protein